MENSEIDRKLGELWRKASGKDYVPEPSASSLRFTESDIETIRFLKNNYSRAEREWRRLLAAKETIIRELSAQLDETSSRLDELKRRYRIAMENAAAGELEAALRPGEAGKRPSR